MLKLFNISINVIIENKKIRGHLIYDIESSAFQLTIKHAMQPANIPKVAGWQPTKMDPWLLQAAPKMLPLAPQIK